MTAQLLVSVRCHIRSQRWTTILLFCYATITSNTSISLLHLVLPRVVLLDLRDNNPLLCHNIMHFQPPKPIKIISDCKYSTTKIPTYSTSEIPATRKTKPDTYDPSFATSEPKGAAKSYKKQKKPEIEKLKEGWEPWKKHQRENPLIMTRMRKIKRRRQSEKGLDVWKWLGKTGIEFHWLGPGTKLKKRLARGDPGINRLDKIAKQHDIDYARAKNLQDKWIADTKMIQSINKLPGKKTLTERLIRKIMQAKKRLKL